MYIILGMTKTCVKKYLSHLSHFGSISGLILANLTLDQCKRCTILNWMTVCRKQIEEECILFKELCHISSERWIFSSSSHCCFNSLRGSQLCVLINEYIVPMAAFLLGRIFSILSKSVSGGKSGNRSQCEDIKLRSCKYRKNYARGTLKFDERWSNDTKLPFE